MSEYDDVMFLNCVEFQIATRLSSVYNHNQNYQKTHLKLKNNYCLSAATMTKNWACHHSVLENHNWE